MKRLIIVCLMIVFIVAVSIMSILKIGNIRKDVTAYIDAITQAVEQEDRQALDEQVSALSDYWEKEERKLMHYVRHTQIDDITKAVARLPALAAGEDFSQLGAELLSISWQMEHIWESELPTMTNLLVVSPLR